MVHMVWYCIVLRLDVLILIGFFFFFFFGVFAFFSFLSSPSVPRAEAGLGEGKEFD